MKEMQSLSTHYKYRREILRRLFFFLSVSLAFVSMLCGFIQK